MKRGAMPEAKLFWNDDAVFFHVTEEASVANFFKSLLREDRKLTER